ncbi:hypothetical protein L1987_02919 [Smallanthus sonchifolius]|uniref:Uncharacterized protein n=1 Tax=Smallanthus sonchifolius TaxID=185202 RepID=A0ACB9K960_9ASTR|nr:hypothetical protein L1987_02919 [Smallanthus sonchifolius]
MKLQELSRLLSCQRKPPLIPLLATPAVPPFPFKTPANYHRSLHRNKEIIIYMRGIAALFRAKNKFSSVYPVKTSWVATLTPKKVKDDGFEKKEEMKNEEVDPIVTFSKLPPVPPVLGPIVLLSLWETWSTPDEN